MPENRPLLIVGDVQGDSERLELALKQYPEDEFDTIFLGDFFQGGRPGFAGGIKAATIAMNRRNSRSLLGNHEVFILGVLEEIRDRYTPPHIFAQGRKSVAELWLARRGDWADLQTLADRPDIEAWLRNLPLLLKLEDGTLAQHCDGDQMAQLGDTPEAVNAFALQQLKENKGVWKIIPYTMGRGVFQDEARLEAYLEHFDAKRVVHGHTKHFSNSPEISMSERVWCFDGRFSRYWGRKADEKPGPPEATIAVLPPL